MFACSLFLALPANSQEVSDEFRVVADARLRYESAEQDDRAETSNALTQMLRLTVEKDLTPRITTLFEGEAVFAILNDFSDGGEVSSSRPVIADPNILGLNRAQVKIEVSETSFLTLGRQSLSVDDERFIGSASFRQNDQTFEGVDFSILTENGSSLEAGYFYAVNRVLGPDNPAGRFEGNSYFLNGNFQISIGRVGLFHYALDLGLERDDALGNVLSSQTSGLRYDGRWHRGSYGMDVQASWARQSNFADNSLDYEADYWMGSGRVFFGPLRVMARLETFEAGETQSFQTPLASLHKFQGLADIFLTTPPEGLRDVQIKADWLLGDIGSFQNIGLSVAAHDFDAWRDDLEFGTEIDLSIKAALDQYKLSATLADYKAKSFGADTRRVFLSLAMRF